MNFRDPRLMNFVQLWRSSRLRGTASTLARNHLRPPFAVPDYLEVVFSPDCPACLPGSTSGPLRINWIIPPLSAGSGGLLNIFRIVQKLEEWGHHNRIYVLGELRGTSQRAQTFIGETYFPIKAEVQPFSKKIADCDALIATSWSTAYAARSIGNTARKFYLVQDLEYMFYAPGSLYEFARRTYEFGFYGITLGPWIAEVLKREFTMDCAAFGFSYDREVYGRTGPCWSKKSGKKRVLFYARPETERRGFEAGVLALSIVAKKMPDAELVLVGSPRGSLALPFKAVCPGVLPVSELAALYRSSDAALVLSHTNLSMLPLELMASGCPVVSNTGPNVEWLLNEEVAQLTEPHPESIADAIIQLLTSDDLRERKINAGFSLAESTDWTREIRVVEGALLGTRQAHRGNGLERELCTSEALRSSARPD